MLFLGILVTFIFIGTTKGYSESVQSGIAEQLIRFHILANSDTEEDQNLKIKVKNEVINLLENELKESKSKDETREILQKNIEKIIDCANQVIKESGYDYDVDAKITFTYFPTKVYGDITLPAGEYEALQITIGNAEGQNWWCVMFPPLCFVDVTFKEVPIEDKILLKNILSEEEYSIVSKAKDEENIPIKVKFKIIEFWQNIINNNA